MKPSVLIIDDDRKIVELLEPALKQAGYRVRHCDNADKGYSLLNSEIADVVLLDIQLPGISGFKLLEMIKQTSQTSRVPVIMLTSRGEESKKVQGLKTGADDYLVKPFSIPELLARIEALLRRVQSAGQPAPVLDLGGIRVDMDKREVLAGGKSVDITPAEFDLLIILMKQPGHVFSYQSLCEAVGGDKLLVSERLYAHVKNLRKKLGSHGDSIENIYGIGYKFRR